MKNLLILFHFIIALVPGHAQNQFVAGDPEGCKADFIANPDLQNPVTIHFQDKSVGQISLWQWNFGDGVTSTQQNPVHTYPHGGTYFVCLTVSNSDSGYVCHDFYCANVTVHQPGMCVADFEYAGEPGNPMMIRFTDKSSGNINRWHWNFGDGSSSDSRNPVHTYSSIGHFNVCLTAYNSDSSSTCNNIRCDTVKIEQPAPCHAEFRGGLDSLNLNPNVFWFENLSTGEPNKFYWSFDDGSHYETPTVAHQFLTPGQHAVCLRIMREVHGVVQCADSVCQTIATANYSDIGGLVFAGSYPINNPNPTGDTVTVTLFRVEGSRLIQYDSRTFTKLGYYAFPRKLQGNYLVRASLTPGSVRFSDYLPTYFSQSPAWKEADVLQLSNTNIYENDIHLIPLNDSLHGPGILRGMVAEALAEDRVQDLQGAEVILYNDAMKPIRFDVSGFNGQFEIRDVPVGAYQLYVDYPGRYSRLTAIWIDSSATLIDNINLLVFDHDVTSVGEFFNSQITIGPLFPNPSSALVNMIVACVKPGALTFEIRSLTGTSAWLGRRYLQPGTGMVTLSLASLQPGVYLLVVGDASGERIAVKKLIRY